MAIKTDMGDAPIVPVMLLMIGGYIAWFGVHYFKSDTVWPTDPIKSVLQGKGLTAVTTNEEQAQKVNLANYIAQYTGGTSSSSSTGSNGQTNSAIANDALKYVGSGYVYGGNASKVGDWDCSSFVSYVLGHDLGIGLPGGSWGQPGFPPNTHGPTTGTYALWGTALNQQEVQPGDLVVWSSHMGIAISNSEIVSAQDEKLGVGTSSIAGTTASLGEPNPHFRRVPGQVVAGIGGAVG